MGNEDKIHGKYLIHGCPWCCQILLTAVVMTEMQMGWVRWPGKRHPCGNCFISLGERPKRPELKQGYSGSKREEMSEEDVSLFKLIGHY